MTQERLYEWAAGTLRDMRLSVVHNHSALESAARELIAEVRKETIEEYHDDVFRRLREASKGEPETFGFVQMFREMLDESKDALKP